MFFSETEPIGYTWRRRERRERQRVIMRDYYKQLAHAIMKAAKSGFRKANNTVPDWVWAPEKQESPWCKFQSDLSLRAEDSDVPAQRQWGRQREREFFSYSALYSNQGFNRLDEVHLLWGKQPALLSVRIQMLISSRNMLTDTPRSNV